VGSVRAYRDPDLVLVESMQAPPPLDDARRSLEYWQHRRKALPLYRRAARREATEMASRWEGRVRAARIASFEASPLGRFFAGFGISMGWLLRVPIGKRGLFALAWAFVPPQVKLLAGAVAATWLLVALAAFSVIVLVLVQLT
jgi:hypothetical protein